MDYVKGTINYCLLVLLIITSSVILIGQPAVIEIDPTHRRRTHQSTSNLDPTLVAAVSIDAGSPATEPAADSSEKTLKPHVKPHSDIRGLFPPSEHLLPGSNNPLRDQPNLSSGRISSVDQIIYGSRKAFTVTKLEYLKKEWCKTEPLKQVIREEGCLQRTVVNRFCYGQCNSFFIPKSNKKDLESAAFKSCSFCKPKRYSWITVTLRCPSKKPRFKRKRIQMIKQCKCMAQTLD